MQAWNSRYKWGGNMHSMRWQSVMFLILFPPIGAILWKLLSRGWATTVQGGRVSEQTRKRQKVLFWFVLGAAYVVQFAGVIARHSRWQQLP